MSKFLTVISTLSPIIVAAIAIVPTLIATISSGRKSRSSIDSLEKKLDAHIEENEWANAKQVRVRILRFADEVCDGKKHSDGLWEDIVDDVDYYEKFCEDHPDFHNNKGKLAMDYLTETYAKLKKDGKI